MLVFSISRMIVEGKDSYSNMASLYKKIESARKAIQYAKMWGGGELHDIMFPIAAV